jgi:3-hydroxybutyryl-CoA dehydrogenase
MHFFNPAPVMPLVEVVAAANTEGTVVEEVRQVAQRMGRTPVRAADMPGFIVNRVARPFYGEALKILGEGTATVAQIDSAMRAAGFKMGPFELMDLIGIDVNFAVTKSVYEAFFGESRYRPSPIQQRMVEAGTLGRKTGQGFYTYTGGEKGEPAYSPVANMADKRAVPFIPEHVVSGFLSGAGIEIGENDPAAGQIVARILAMIINEAVYAVGEGVASVRDIDIAMKLGTNYPKGPLKWGDEIGLDVVFSVLKGLLASLGDDRYRVAPLLWQMVRSGATGDAVGEGFHKAGEKGMV